MKKLLLGLSLGLLGVFAQAQNGLEDVIVERYYVANAADHAGSPGTDLPEGAVTYRIYVDMLPGYNFQMAYGDPNHTLVMTTTTQFYNNSDRGGVNPTLTAPQAKTNTNMLDSYLTTGAACGGFMGILKSEDNATGNFVITPAGLLVNADPSAGIPLTTRDGMWAVASLPNNTMIGLSAAELEVFNASVNNNIFTTSNGGWSAQGGAVGPTATNRVLIAQITTDGTFHYEMCIQVGTPDFGFQSYVPSSPIDAEISDPSLHLSGTYTAGNEKPTISLTSPLDGTSFLTGNTIAIAATATDTDGTIASVVFRVDGTIVATDVTAPYQASYVGVNGSHVITAVATDDGGKLSDIATANIFVGADPAPSVNITAPASTIPAFSSIVGDTVYIAANATDNGSVASVQFFVDGVSLSTDGIAPFTAKYVGVLGTHALTARATDNIGQFTTSAPVSIQVKNNTPPSTSITSPVNGASINMNTLVTISANAADIDGTVASVEFRANGVSLGVDASSPYTIDWTPTVEGSVNLTTIATDNKGAIATSAIVVVNIINLNALPYEISRIDQTCLPGSVCMPLVSTKATMSGVIGYDVTLNYNSQKVMPTGIITVSNDLIASSLTTYTVDIDTAHSLMNVAVFFNGSAPIGTTFHGAGQLFCAQFNKTANFHSIDTALFSATLEESYASSSVLSKPVKSGKFITYKDSTFHGSLKFWFDNSPIKYNTANPNEYLVSNIFGCGKATDAVQPDTLGNFVYNIWNGTSVNIRRDILNTTNVHPVISSQDALYTSYISVKNTRVFTPSIYQMVAMDVNADGQVSAGDASQINQRAVSIIPEFNQVWNASNGKPSNDWLFVNAATLAGNAYHISATFPANDGIGYSKYKVPVVDTCQSVPVLDYLECPLITNDLYQGILIGDVDASYAAIPKDGLLKAAGKNTSEDMIVLDLAKSKKLYNGDITVPVSLTSSSVVNSFDFDLVIDDKKIEVKSVNNPNALNMAWNYIAADKLLLVASYSMNPIPANEAISLSVTLSGTEKLSSADFNATLALVNGKKATLKVIENPTGLSQNELGNLVNIYPNPAADVLNIEVPENSKIEIFEVTGKELVLETKAIAYQVNAIDVSNFAAGLYLVKVSNENYVTMQKVIVNK